MGQNVSSSQEPLGSTALEDETVTYNATGKAESCQLMPLSPYFLPLCDIVKIGDATTVMSATLTDSKDALEKILEFNDLLQCLPEGLIPSSSRSELQELMEITLPMDSVQEIFQHISRVLCSTPNISSFWESYQDVKNVIRPDDTTAVPGAFEARISSYIQHLQSLYHLTKKEKYQYEQRSELAISQASLQRKIASPPLPLPTQGCIAMGWDLAIYLIRSTWTENPKRYVGAIDMIKANLRPLKAMAYAETSYLSPSASHAFSELSDCLEALIHSEMNALNEERHSLTTSTAEALAEVGVARGSLATLLTVIRWLLKQSPDEHVNISPSLSKLSALREQPMYGKCESFGELYSCGQNSYGELGLGDDIERHQLTSVPLCGWDHIRQVVSGNEILAILTSDGVVLTCGLNKSGQCGHGNFDERVMLLRPIQALRSHRVKYINASNGCEHLIAITDTGLAYSWGYNDRGQLGHENVGTKLYLPKLIESIKEKKMKSAAVSYHHSALVSVSGELYTFGMNDCGQLGLDHTQHQSTPQLVKALLGHHVSMVSCGLYHMVLCTISGEVFTCGKNDHGQLGLGHNKQVKVPTQVVLPNELVCFVACGYYHATAITSTGLTYSFGRNDYGQLGIGSKIHQNIPIALTISSNTRMVHAACGCYHTLLMSDSGQVFVFGRNNKGQLGNRGNTDSLLPVPLKVRPEKNMRRCLHIAAGFYTTSLIVERKRENDEGDAVLLNENCITPICGRVDIDRSGEVEGLSNFGTMSTMGVSLFCGKWFYEVELITCGLIQIGWIDNYFQGSSDQGEGVGDHEHSWSYDGNRQRRWNSGSSSYGDKWKPGDVIGCLLDLDTYEMTFFRNGISLGVAFTDCKVPSCDPKRGLRPGISLERGEIVRINLGHQAFAFPPTTIAEFDGIARAILLSAPSASINSLPYTSNSSFDAPPDALCGSATVMAGSRIFVIGGSAPAEVKPSNLVWVYDATSHSWERWSDFPLNIRHHQAVLIENTDILVLGGEEQSANSRHMHTYKCSITRNEDGSLPQWELILGSSAPAQPLPTSRAFHSAAVVDARLDTLVLVYGGRNIEDVILDDVWCFSLDDFTWSRLPSSTFLDPGPRTGCSLSATGESVYLFGGLDRDDNLRADLWCFNVFDRAWYLVHDDDINAQKSGTTCVANFGHGFIPEARKNYSLVTDIGTVWIFGGQNQADEFLDDLWSYSVASRKWNAIEMHTEEGKSTKIGSSRILIERGVVTALSCASDSKYCGADSRAYLYLINLTHQGLPVYSISACSSPVYNTKNGVAAGRLSHISTVLRSRTGTTTSNRNTYSCAFKNLDSGVSVLSHLDRLAGTDVLVDDTETVQLSRCSYRSLCIDPKKKTFEALLDLLSSLNSAFSKWKSLDGEREPDIPAQVVLEVLYPLFVCLRLLKLNLYELSRCCPDTIKAGLSKENESAPERVLNLIQHELFDIVEHPVTLPATLTDVTWICTAVEQESALCIYHGYASLFPSLAERLDVLKYFLQNGSLRSIDLDLPVSSVEIEDICTRKGRLLPMLMSCFTSHRMLFQLMSYAEITPGNAIAPSTSLTKVAQGLFETLMSNLWGQTTAVIEKWTRETSSNTTKCVAALEELEQVVLSDEFKVLNVLLRANAFWVARSFDSSWETVQFVITRIITYMVNLTEMVYTVTDNFDNRLYPWIIQSSFCGKVLPFLILSTLSFQNVRDDFHSMAAVIWPPIKCLLLELHDAIKDIDAKFSGSIKCDRERCLAGTKDDLQASNVMVSEDLSHVLFGHPAPDAVSSHQVLQALWTKRTELVSGGDKHFVQMKIPSDLEHLLGTNTLMVKSSELPVDETQVNDLRTLFSPSWTILSQHIYPLDYPLGEVKGEEDEERMATTINLRPFHMKSIHHSIDRSYHWLKDLRNILAWAGSHYASALVASNRSLIDHELVKRWFKSPLLVGGLENDVIENPGARELENTHIRFLRQIVENEGNGKKFLDKIRLALELGGINKVPTTINPKIQATRLRRQDSVEAALQKSGSFEAVDRAVRSTFAVLLKHTQIGFMSSSMIMEGTLSHKVLDLWRASLQLRRWIVREQQKLAASISDKKVASVEPVSREYQQELYNTVCEPLLLRANLLLKFAAACVSHTFDESLPVKNPEQANVVLEAGTLSPETDLDNFSNESKSSEEDERIQAEVFSFLQQSWTQDCVSMDSVDPESISLDVSHRMKQLVLDKRELADNRVAGLQIFHQLLISTTDPNARQFIISALAVAFKRIQLSSKSPVSHTICPQAFISQQDCSSRIQKVHFLADLELIGGLRSQKISDEFFQILSSLFEASVKQLESQCVLSTDNKEDKNASRGSQLCKLRGAVHDMLSVLDLCSLPYRSEDWKNLEKIGICSLLKKLANWDTYAKQLDLASTTDLEDDSKHSITCPLLSAATGARLSKLMCGKNITIKTDLHKLTLVHSLKEGKISGGFAICSNPFSRGRWFWEVSIQSQHKSPVFIGVATSALDLNSYSNEKILGENNCTGIYAFHDYYISSSSHHRKTEMIYPVDGQGYVAVQVVLDCGEGRLDFYMREKRFQSHYLHDFLNQSIPDSYYAVIGLEDAQVVWDLAHPIPAKLWANSIDFRFRSPVIAGDLIATPYRGQKLGWSSICSKHVVIAGSGDTIVAGYDQMPEELYETIVLSHSFNESDLFYMEIYPISGGFDSRIHLTFDIVGNDFFREPPRLLGEISKHKQLAVDCLLSEVDKRTCRFGVLFDFTSGNITRYTADGKACASAQIDLTGLGSSYRPALRVLLNGAVIYTDTHPAMVYPKTANMVIENATLHTSPTSRASKIDIPAGKGLDMKIFECDGGETNTSHMAKNCLVDDASVFSSNKSKNIHLILKHQIDTPFCVSYLSLRGPGSGYTHPAQHILVFITSKTPVYQDYAEFDDFTPEQFAALPFPPAASRQFRRDEHLPVAYIILDGSCSQVNKPLLYPVSGRFIVCKLLTATTTSFTRSAIETIDFGYIGVYGTFDEENGPAYSDETTLDYCDECKRLSQIGLTYSTTGTETATICASCFDDFRGIASIHNDYEIFVSAEKGEEDSPSTALMPRKVWHAKTSSMYEALESIHAASRSATSKSSSLPNNTSISLEQKGKDCQWSSTSSPMFEECEIFSCGQNNYGELCLGHCNPTNKLERASFFSYKSIQSIAGGNEVLVVLMKDGAVFTCGLNKSGQCGIGNFDERLIVPSPIPALSGIPITMVAASNGCEHMLAISHDGAVYSWGYNDRGQLGLGTTVSKSHTPRVIESLREKYFITFAAVSYHHSAVVSNNGDLLTFGMNDSGQLGLDHTQHQHTPQLVETLSSQKVGRVACGLYHTVAIVDDGDVYSFGKNEYGQLGLSHTQNTKVPMLVKIPPAPRTPMLDAVNKAVQVYCGYYHTVTILECGKVVTWGRNDYGQLGIGSKEHKSIAQFVPLPLTSRVKRASCGCYHTLLLLVNGRPMVFGRNNKGQLGVASRSLPSADLPLPIPLHPLSSDEVVYISAGFYCSYILTGKEANDQLQAMGGNPTENPAEEMTSRTCRTSEKLFQDLMKQMDHYSECMQKLTAQTCISAYPVVVASKNVTYKSGRTLALVKLYSASWALVRGLMHQSLSGDNETTSKVMTTQNPVVRSLLDFLLAIFQSSRSAQPIASETQSLVRFLELKYEDEKSGVNNSCFSLRNACLGLTRCFLTLKSFPSLTGPTQALWLRELCPQLLNNQVLSLLLCCSSMNDEICSVLAANNSVIAHTLSSFDSDNLTTAMISFRLAMLLFPFHSVDNINTVYREQTSRPSGNILRTLILLVGRPLITRPKLCHHELGIECCITRTCEKSSCMKKACRTWSEKIPTASEDHALERLLDRYHVALAKSDESLALLRYMTMFSSWKAAVNDTMTLALQKQTKINDMAQSIATYYTRLQEDSAGCDTFVRKDEGEDALRQAEITKVSSHAPGVFSLSSDASASERVSENVSPDEKEVLNFFIKARESLDDIACIMAAVAIFGGHSESLREGCAVISPAKEVDNSERFVGTLSNVTLDKSTFEPMATILLSEPSTSKRKPEIGKTTRHYFDNDGAGTFNLFTMSNARSTPRQISLPLKQLRALEKVPPMFLMCNDVQSVISVLSSLSTFQFKDHMIDEASIFRMPTHQPGHFDVLAAIYGDFFESVQNQLHWRSTKALYTIYKQMSFPSPSEELTTPMTELLNKQIISTLAAIINDESLLLGSNSNCDTNDSLDTCWQSSQSKDRLNDRWLNTQIRKVYLGAQSALDSTIDHHETKVRAAVIKKMEDENELSWGLDALQSPKKEYDPAVRSGKPLVQHQILSVDAPTSEQVDQAAANTRTSIPSEAWGVLYPLPVLQDTDGSTPDETPLNTAPFPLVTSVVRVGRAPDSCDMVVNDRSVSGRHFHLRRIHGNDGEQCFELQDFSKNGSIVNGVRVHGTSTRISPGSRISIILSRGGLASFEFQVRETDHTGHLSIADSGSRLSLSNPLFQRMPPPTLVTSGRQSTVHGVGNSSSELQHSVGTETTAEFDGNPSSSVEPRSPAQLQNRGANETITQAATDGARVGARRQSLNRIDAFRSRFTSQGLRLITSVTESDVPRALVSPNPAIDSPRLSSFNSPRSSIFQMPGTPSFGSPTGSTCISTPTLHGILSPASYQQHESSAAYDTTVNLPPASSSCSEEAMINEALRMVLGRENLPREKVHEVAKSRIPYLGRLRTMLPMSLGNSDTANTSSAGKEKSQIDYTSRAVDLRSRVQDHYGYQVAIEYCEEALVCSNGDLSAAFLRLQSAIEEVTSRQKTITPFSSNAFHLAQLLNRDEFTCTEALLAAGNNLRDALRLLLKQDATPVRHPAELSIVELNNSTINRSSTDDNYLRYQESTEENPSYALAESCNPAGTDASEPAPIHRWTPNTRDPCRQSKENLPVKFWTWLQCNTQSDGGIDKTSYYESHIEEIKTGNFMTAVYARKTLLHLLRQCEALGSNLEKDVFASFSAALLRRLVLSMREEPEKRKGEVKLQTLQVVLKRMISETFITARGGNAMVSILRQSQAISILMSEIDNCDPRSSITKSFMMRMFSSLRVMEEKGTKEDTTASILKDETGPISEHLFIDAILHILSRSYCDSNPTMLWDPTGANISLQREPIYWKGPLTLSCGLDVVVVNTLERLWSLAAPDPLLQYRHKWRNQKNRKKSDDLIWMKPAHDSHLTLWRPVLPFDLTALSSAGSKHRHKTTGQYLLEDENNWFSLGDILTCTYEVGEASPKIAALLVYDHHEGLLAPPVGFQRIDVTGKGLPLCTSETNSELYKKQQRSIWWPIAPPGYISLGCVAGTKQEPLMCPSRDSVRCVRQDLVLRTAKAHSVYHSKQSHEDGSDEDEEYRTSLLVTHEDFVGGTVFPSAMMTDDSKEHETAVFHLSEEDKIICGPVTVKSVLQFVKAYVCCKNSEINTHEVQTDETPSALAQSLFILLKQVIAEANPTSATIAVCVVRAMISVIRKGEHWNDKAGLLFCRSKIMRLYQEQENGLMVNSLCQALIELLLTVQDHNRATEVERLKACTQYCSNLTSPYRFQFSRQVTNEMLVSHSSKILVTRYAGEDERKFLLEYHPEHPPSDKKINYNLEEDCHSCRFENTPELRVFMHGDVKAEIVYYELTIMEWKDGSVFTDGNEKSAHGFPVFALGFSAVDYALEGPCIGMKNCFTADATTPSRSYSFLPFNSTIHTSDPHADQSRWNDQVPPSITTGDNFGCGIRLDSQEIFFTKNGYLLGTTFFSVDHPSALHPTISCSTDCKLLINFGSLNHQTSIPTEPETGLTEVSSATVENTCMDSNIQIPMNFHFRFGSMDFENLMAAFEWFEPINQVYGIMKAMLASNLEECHTTDSQHNLKPLDSGLVKQLPDEFMLSADTFLAEVAEDVCLRVESKHPYDLELQEAFVNIPLACSIRVRLSPSCQTDPSHCLQILQGGDTSSESDLDGRVVHTGATSVESEVRAFTGACGGQEVMIEGDRFIWRFPVQSNFQSRVDRVRKGPYLRLENRDTRLSLTRDKGWQTAIGVARFDSGVHIWEIRIAFVTASSNIFLGIARKDVRLDSYLGKDNRGWGWIGNRALWHNGSKQRGTYGEKFKSGDLVRMTLDLKRGTLSYAVNGKDLGIAFGPGGLGSRLEGVFYPGFALYNQRDCIDLSGGHRVDDGHELARTPGPGMTENTLEEEDAEYYSDEEDHLDNEDSSLRLESAAALTQMGFPLDWCIYALRQRDDDVEQAADFLLSNLHVMDGIINEEMEEQRRHQIRPNDRVNRDIGVSGVGNPSVRGFDSQNAGSDAEVVGEEENTDSEIWGIAFTAVPEFSLTGRRILASRYAQKLQQLHSDQSVFTLEHDEAITRIVNEVCESRAEGLLSCDPLRMTPEEFSPTNEHLRKFRCLESVPLCQLQKRFLILRNFNSRLQTSLSFVDFVAESESSVLARGIHFLRGIIFQHVKLTWWLGVLREQQAPVSARPEIEIDRHRTFDSTEQSDIKDTVFDQAFAQLHYIQPSLLRGSDRAFKCQFAGEFGDDFGGLYRECLAQISCELQSKALPLFQPCPNAHNATGENREQFVPNVQARSDNRNVEMYEFLGKLIGIAIRTKTPLDLNLPTVVWKLLVGEPVCRNDIEQIHRGCFKIVDTIQNIENHGITESMFDEIVDTNFTVMSSTNEVVELVTGGEDVRVTWQDKEIYARAVENHRLNEFRSCCEDILRGIATILPANTLSLFTWKEFSTLVCGKATVDIDLLQKRTVYGDGCQAKDPHIAYFWQILSEFTDEQKSSFLRFVWGRSRLPTHAADFTQDFKISGLPKAAMKPDAYLPVAHTCFFSVDLPAYTSKKVMNEKLLYAITHCQSIDADNTTLAQRAGQGINWTNLNAATAAESSSTPAASGISSGPTNSRPSSIASSGL
uniref:Uncharacterized protein AlNc14C17G1798 n=1 Tax=Albugo laibachii Nc14 TaxID=890382 RepID=F0W4D8_9STRA|nr:conserved hypothetical protein [Albugo laibachii Nc14]|eukprot:CCA15971.1 conserved hypothetical protein [Albugo laibachii Nc14]